MKLKTILITLLLTLFISACSTQGSSSEAQDETNVKVVSQERVNLLSPRADSYLWRQISGEIVIMIDASKQSMSFIAPNVDAETELLFEVEYLVSSLLGDDTINKKRVQVTIKPKETNETNTPTENNTTTSTDNNSTTPIDNNKTTPSDNNSTAPTDNNKTISTDNSNTTSPTISNPLKSIKLTISNNSLNIETNTTLNTIATYKDNTTKDITEEVEWISTDSNAIEINKHHLKAKKETNIILQARLNAITSNAVALEIYKNINGHKLPAQPDETLNNSTLLGIDSNDNGVRDDVERWIFEEYKEPIVQAVAMQNARAFGKILVEPSRARETVKFMHNQTDCEGYYMYDDPQQRLSKENKLYEESRPLILNTRERSRAYYEYNQALSGGVYSRKDRNTHQDNCDFNETKVERGEW